MASRPQRTVADAAAIGLLLSRVARDEIERLSRVESVEALVAHASAQLAAAAAAQAKLTALIERGATPETIAAYLRETSLTAAADLRVLAKSRGRRLNVPALAERVAIATYHHELEAEVALALARTRLDEEAARRISVDALLDLASQPGRWSRRTEALRVLRLLVWRGVSSAAVADRCALLAAPTEHRWVQPLALEVLARIDPPRAVALATKRFAEPLPGDDFLVRERIAELSARLRKGKWSGVLALAAQDASEHVRLAAARAMRDETELSRLAVGDASEKVRAQALITLAKRRPAAAEPVLLGAVSADASPFAVQTAAEVLTSLADRRSLAAKGAPAALLERAKRPDMPLKTRLALIEEAATIEVLVDPFLRVLHDLVASVVTEAPVGGAVRLSGKAVENLSDEQLGRVLSVLARSDFGLSAERTATGFIVHRGDVRSFAPWRAMFELTHPLPSKRQGYSHTWGRRPRGTLRAPPQSLAELTATNVPGERVLVGKRGDWGRHLPLVDDLLAALRAPARLVGPHGITKVEPPAGLFARGRAWVTLTRSYARLAELRRRSLDSDEAAVQRAFVEQAQRETGIAISFEPHAFARSLGVPPELGIVPAGLALDGVLRDLLHYAVSPEGNRLSHVGAYAATVLAAMIARGVVTRRRIDSDRKAIPLVIGGWGTRGKSGTERLKAGLFQGLGHETLVKTTGCEAMFIHAIPGVRAQEVFIYRPYDKATIWEQRALLRLGARFKTRVFLYECMALQPDLVNVLQEQWMRDDYSTITNAYPDHEDVQGPAGIDVAQCITEFVPTNGRLFTAEDQMLPLVRERAKSRGSTLRAVGDREAGLIAGDILARYPYHEHPKNIALVCAVAQALGVPTSIALAEMADHVVPDLGVLKSYPRVPYAGRTLTFTNGMSANERTGALANWTRMDFDKYVPDREPARFIVTVVNNRADRVARSEVFAKFIVQDIAAHRHVLIGTNVSGLLGFTREALGRHLAEIAPSRDLAGSPEERQALAKVRIEKAFAQLAIGTPTAASFRAELAALGLPPLDDAERWLTPARDDEGYEDGKRALSFPYPDEARSFVVEMIAKRRVARAVMAALSASLAADPARVDRVFSAAYRAIFEGSLIVLTDATLTGDQVVDAVARAAPPGAHVDIMGIQNIKGTGLDFVYRWVSLDAVQSALDKVNGRNVDEGLKELLAHDDYGLVDAQHALATLESRRDGERFDPALTRLRELVARKSKALSAKRSKSAIDRVRAAFGKTFDYLDSVRRQSLARSIVDDLVAGRLSHAAAAVEMRDVVARAKGAWALAKT